MYEACREARQAGLLNLKIQYLREIFENNIWTQGSISLVGK
jgi:hypothetical protein